MIIKSAQIKAEEDKIHIMPSKFIKLSDMVTIETRLYATYKNVTQTIRFIAIIQVSCGCFVKVFSGIMAFNVKGTNMKIDLYSDNN